MSEAIKERVASLDEDAVGLWLDQLRDEGKLGRFVQAQLGRALEHHDSVAEDFLRKANKLDPEYIKKSRFNEEAKRLKRLDALASHSSK